MENEVNRLEDKPEDEYLRNFLRLDRGDFDQEDFNRLVESKGGKTTVLEKGECSFFYVLEVMLAQQQWITMTAVLLWGANGTIRRPSNTSKYCWVWNESTKLWTSEPCDSLKAILTSLRYAMINKIIKKLKKRGEKLTDAEKYRLKNYEDSIEVLESQKLDKLRKDVVEIFLMHCLDAEFEKKLNLEPEKIPTKGGKIIDMRTCEIRDRTMKDLWSQEIPVEWNPKADRTHVDCFFKVLFLQDRNDFPEYKDMGIFLILFLGYCFTGYTQEQIMSFFLGDGGAGKSLLISLLRLVMGPFFSVIPSSMLVEHPKSSHVSSSSPAPNPVYDSLQGVRLGAGSEVGSNGVLKSQAMKSLTGQDVITYRKLYENTIRELIPTFKMIIICNDLPGLQEFDHSVMRRLLVLFFPAMFVDNPDPNNPRERQIDKTLEDKLKTEESKEALLCILVEGVQHYLRLRDEKKSVISQSPQCVKDAKKEWLSANTSFIEQFIIDKIEITKDKNDKISTSVLYQTFDKWVSSSRDITSIKGAAQFGKAITSHLKTCSNEEMKWETKLISSKKMHVGIKIKKDDF